MSHPRARPRALSWLFLAHAAATLAAAVVLVVAPGLIPRMVGIAVRPEAYLVCYLLAAAELGFAVLSYQASRLTDVAALRAAAAACVALHGASALLEGYVLARGASAVVWGNVAARVAIIALFLRCRPPALSDGAEPAARS